MTSNKKVILFDVLFLASLWIAGILFVNPLGEFPLNDDWSFSLTAHNFALTGNYQPVGWAAMPLISNVLWGGLFEKLFGYSFFSLRLSTLVAGILGVVGTYLMALELGLSRKIRLLIALLLLTNPIYFSLSYSYMTDVPFAALIILSCLVFINHLKTQSNWSYILGIVLAVFAVLSRQLALSIPLAFMLVFLLAHGISKKNIVRSLIPLIVVTSSLVLYQHWLSVTGRLPALYDQKNSQLLEVLLHPHSLVLNLAVDGFKAILYFGAFLSPLLFLYLSKNDLRRKFKPILLIGGFNFEVQLL